MTPQIDFPEFLTLPCSKRQRHTPKCHLKQSEKLDVGYGEDRKILLILLENNYRLKRIFIFMFHKKKIEILDVQLNK
jgi:hypothetical protein